MATTTNRILNKLGYAMENVAADITTATSSDRVLVVDVSETPDEIKYADGPNLLEIIDTTATAAEITRAADVSTRIVNLTAATLSVTEALHDGKVVTVNKADGTAITLPAATGSGTKLHFVIGTTITSVGTTIKVTGDDTMTGTALLAQDAADTAVLFETAATSDTITLNGSTTGGIKGDSVELIDIAADLWWVRLVGSATGTEATPFSATVS